MNGKIASMLGLQNLSILSSKENSLRKLFTFVPVDKAEQVRDAIFEAGGGHIGNYSECSFNTEGTGTFKAGQGADPYTGEIGKRHFEKEIKIEVIFPGFLERKIVMAMKAAHPYEEVAYDVVLLSNTHQELGPESWESSPSLMMRNIFISFKEIFKVPVIRHSALLNKSVKKVAICGGAGSFLISKALASEADAYVTADMKYHEFFDANGRMLITDIGHYESEQFTINLLYEVLAEKFPTFAVLKTEVETNPVRYFCK